MGPWRIEVASIQDVTGKTLPEKSDWQQAVAEHRKPVLRSGLWQLCNSLLPYLALWGLMIWTLNISYWITRARMKNKALYAVVFPFLLFVSYFGRNSRPTQGAGVLVRARKVNNPGG